ncbi:MAG: Anaerobic sulfite reductase subunit B [Verrucomicrobia bacterium ADurb.Bin345]|nr:MAG: Anaerobic sulfite reductase subunit B [Verrucomicrobia bacterium ADurb.Bin345]
MISSNTAQPMKDIYLPEPADVLKASPMTALEMFFEFRLASGRELGHMPGQFVEVSIPGIGEAPISISSSPTQKGSFQMVVRKVGNVSGAMHALSAGRQVGIRGPFGTHFPVDGEMKGKDILFICGGIGLVPVRSAINYVLDHRDDYGHVTILFGTKTPADRLFTDEMQRWASAKDVTFMETVDRGDDAWKGNVGVITTLIPKVRLDPARTVAVVCGPPIMYKFVILELDKVGLKADRMYVSLERHMKCGVGKCGHCQVNGLYACQDGAVFKYSDIASVREAI